jgi:hypothetical protein
MKIDKKQAQLMGQLIEEWEEKQVVNAEQAGRMKESLQEYEVKNNFDWQNLSFIAFFFATTCIILSVVLLLADEWLMDLLDTILVAHDGVKALFFGILAAFLYYWAVRKRHLHPEKVYSNEAIFLFGAIALAFAWMYIGFLFDTGSGHFPMVMLLTAVSYGVIGIYLNSQLTWLLSLLTLAVWFGTETAYRSHWEPYFWGMNYPLRYVIFGTGLILLSRGFNKMVRIRAFAPMTYFTGLIGLFFALWLLSIFGNHGEWDVWYQVSQLRLFYWAILSGIASCVAIWYGLRYEDAKTKDIGIAFLLLNLYTRYFEYFWDHLHKVIFFSLLALSFWLIGRKAEQIWNLSGQKKEE